MRRSLEEGFSPGRGVAVIEQLELTIPLGR